MSARNKGIAIGVIIGVTAYYFYDKQTSKSVAVVAS